MKKTTLLFLFFCAGKSFCQNPIPYADFVAADTGVKWAALYTSYVNLTPVNPQYDIRKFYAAKLKKSAVTSYSDDPKNNAVTSGTTNDREFINHIRAVDFDETRMNWWLRYDNRKNNAESIFLNEKNSCDTCLLKNKLSFFKVKQLLRYQDNKFYINNILLSPVIYTKEKGSFKEQAQCFETVNFAFQDPRERILTIPSDARYIGRACNNLVLIPNAESARLENSILTPENWNLAGILHEDILSGNIQAYNADKSIYPDKKYLVKASDLDAYKNPADTVMVLDSLGEVTEYRAVRRTIDYDSIYSFTWYRIFILISPGRDYIPKPSH
ncbi:MAG: hypothetical protein IPI66_07905 [Chitinophagaceae bacterium]|nr:hypothetical protein [Chitinophagaceae bacterium]